MSFYDESASTKREVTNEEAKQRRRYEAIKRNCRTLCMQCNWKACPKVHSTERY